MTVFDLAEKTTFETNKAVKIVVTWTDSGKLHRYEGIILPLIPGGLNKAKWTYDPVGFAPYDQPGIYLQSGWLYLVGNMPLAKSEHVIAAAEGSQIVLRVDPAGFGTGQEKAAVIFLDGTKVTIDHKGAYPNDDDHVINVEKKYNEYKQGVIEYENYDLSGDYLSKISYNINNAAVATSTQSPKL